MEGTKDDKIDIIASDHAPHTIEEKNNKYLAVHQEDLWFNILFYLFYKTVKNMEFHMKK